MWWMLVHNKPAMLSAFKNVGVLWAEVRFVWSSWQLWTAETVKHFPAESWSLIHWVGEKPLGFRSTRLKCFCHRPGKEWSCLEFDNNGEKQFLLSFFFFFCFCGNTCVLMTCSLEFNTILIHSHCLGLELLCWDVYVRGYWRKIKSVLTVLRDWIQKPTEMIPVSILIGRQIRTGGFS